MTTEALVLQTSPIITFGYVVQVIFSLLIVIVLIYLCAKFLLPKLKFGSNGRYLKIIDRVYLEPNVCAYILSIGKASWLVISSHKNIAKVDRIDELINE